MMKSNQNREKFLVVLIIIITGLLSSCSNTSEPRDAKLTDLATMRVSPGFEWFDSNYNSYTPDPVKIAQINAKIQDPILKDSIMFIMFVNPSCSCTGTQQDFPETMKILNSSGIKTNQYQIYTMVSSGDNQPYSNKFHINQLPSLYLMIGSKVKYSILDSLTFDKILDSKKTYYIEDYILKALN